MDQAPKKSTPWWVILLAIFGVGGLLVVAAIVGVYVWFSSNKDRLLADGKKAQTEATAFAADHEQTECVDEGLRRGTGCDGIMCEAMTKVFVDACLHKARPTETICTSVPVPTDIMDTSRWLIAECQRRGHTNDQRCTRIVQAVPEFCGRRRP